MYVYVLKRNVICGCYDTLYSKNSKTKQNNNMKSIINNSII